MPKLILRNVPDALYRQLKAAAASHRRSMSQEAIVSLQAGLDETAPKPPRPDAREIAHWLRREVWSLPERDGRSDDDILGYNDRGRFD